jgi:hypothetical protein
MEEPVRRRFTRRHAAAALLACTALTAAVAGRIGACAGCEYEIAGVPLFVAGSIYYLALGLLALWGANLIRLGWLSLPGLALQAGLARFLLMLGAACVTCLIAAVSLLGFSLVCLLPDTKWRFAPLIVAAAGMISLPLWSGALVQTERVEGLPEFARASDLQPPPDGAALLVMYEKEGCPYCRLFARDYEPRLAQDFGKRLVVRRIDATSRGKLGRVPSFVARAPDGSLHLIRGLPPYAELARLISE